MCRHVNFEEMDSDSSTKKMMNFAYCEQYLTNISKQNIIMAVLRKRNSHSVAICRLIKKSVKEDPKRKTDSKFDFSQAA